MARIFCKWGSW